MLRTRRPLLIPVVLASVLIAALGAPSAFAKVRINGSTTVNPVVIDAAALLRAEEGLEVLIDTVGGSSGGITALGDHRVEIGMSSWPLNNGDFKRFPSIGFQPTAIGFDSVALVVSNDVWVAGIRDLSRQQIRDLYEGKIANWLYGSATQARLVSLLEVGANEEARNKVATTPGAITQLSASWVTGERIHALGLWSPDGEVVHPSREEMIDGRYPLVRPLLVTHDLAQARRIADHIGCVCLRGAAGELIEAARCDEVFASPCQPVTARYLGQAGRS